MPALPVPATVEFQLRGYHEDDKRETVMHYRHGLQGPPPDAADLTFLAHQWESIVWPHVFPCVTAFTTWTDLKVIDISVLHGLQTDDTTGFPSSGNRNGEPLPGFAQVCLTKQVNVHQRGTLGRMFVMDISEQDQNDDVIQNALINLLLQLALALLQHFIDAHGQSYAPVVASKKHGVFYTMTGVEFDSIMDTLRTRGKGKRRHRRRPPV